MSDPAKKRSLTDREKAGYEVVKNFERAIKENRLSITLSCTREAAGVIGRLDGKSFRVLKVEFNPVKMHYAVTFDLPNYRKYMEFVLPHCGLRLEIDGSFTTLDNLVISNEYLGSEMELPKHGT